VINWGEQLPKTGNSRARKALVEAAWTYRHSAGTGVQHQQRQKDLPQVVRDIAWKVQTRLCARFRRLMAKGKHDRRRGHCPRDRGLPVGDRPACCAAAVFSRGGVSNRNDIFG